MYYFEDAIAETTRAPACARCARRPCFRFPLRTRTSYEDSLATRANFIQKWRGHP
jgi:hypothetical protein